MMGSVDGKSVLEHESIYQINAKLIDWLYPCTVHDLVKLHHHALIASGVTPLGYKIVN